jgi:hypothetical protein
MFIRLNKKLVKNTFLLSLAILLFIYVQQVDAHGGVEKNIGNTIVVLNQSPLSPVAGETVKMNFVLKDKDSFKNSVQTPVTLKIIDTFAGDES